MQKYTKQEVKAKSTKQLLDYLNDPYYECECIEIITAQDEKVCNYCKQHAGVYHIKRAPILPHNECTAPPLTKRTEGDTWCRCWYSPTIKGVHLIMQPDKIFKPEDYEGREVHTTTAQGCLTALIGFLIKPVSP